MPDCNDASHRNMNDPASTQPPERVDSPAPLREDAGNAQNPRNSGIRLRAILLGLLLLPMNAFWVVDMEYVRYSAHPTTISLFFNCVFILIVLAALNKLVALVHRPWALRQPEPLLIYSMLCIGSCMAGHDFSQVLVSSLAWPFAHDNETHPYRVFWHLLPSWAVVKDTVATDGFFHGHDTLYSRSHLLALWRCCCWLCRA